MGLRESNMATRVPADLLTSTYVEHQHLSGLQHVEESDSSGRKFINRMMDVR